MSDEFQPELGTEFTKIWSSTLNNVVGYYDVNSGQEWINLESVASCFGSTKEDIVGLLEQGITSVPTFDPTEPKPRVYWISSNGTEVIPYDYLWRVYSLINE